MKKLFYITLTIMMCAVSWPALSGQSAGLKNNDAPMLIMDIGAGSGDIVGTVATLPAYDAPFAVVSSINRSWRSSEAIEPMLSTAAFHIEDPGRGIRPQV